MVQVQAALGCNLPRGRVELEGVHVRAGDAVGQRIGFGVGGRDGGTHVDAGGGVFVHGPRRRGGVREHRLAVAGSDNLLRVAGGRIVVGAEPVGVRGGDTDVVVSVGVPRGPVRRIDPAASVGGYGIPRAGVIHRIVRVVVGRSV